MTRKDYINIAGAILATQARIRGDAERTEREVRNISASTQMRLKGSFNDQLRGVRRTAAHLATFLADDNPRFDQTRFLKACGYGGNAPVNRDPELLAQTRALDDYLKDMPGMRPQTYEEFSRDCDRHDGR